MALAVVNGATIICTQGTAPGVLCGTAQAIVLIGGPPVITKSDVQPIVNVGCCGMCISMANPQVASATAAALGVLTPMPCIPSPMGMWQCGSAVMVGGKPALTNDGILACTYGGSISITNAAQTTVTL